ncbi:tetratricopeptide repeat protein [Actinomadura viridis]|uniref:Tetratricopeptide (TPR) repeat protein n=1 Tax=Actinomadura viridis TaxID=58110 RepID=A0A931DSK6_9ACTN|nr:tetratricopeptide repeat protein [Actinomadura viridis]MBG6091928.1 tetratricopeptide (TPR) repeat protein [Actinomadura viridis]
MQRPSDDRGESHPQENRADIADVGGSIFQARDISGGISVYNTGTIGRAGAPPRQLPGDISHFINRTAELAALENMLTAAPQGDQVIPRVFVISGSAGVGKTALALRWAHTVRSRFRSGDLYVNLRGYDDGPPQDPASALDRMLRALGMRNADIPRDVEDRAAVFRTLTSDRDILILLDNAVSTSQVRPLLPGSAKPLVIVTSRSTLPALAVRDGATRVHLDTLRKDDALALLKAVSQHGRSDSDAELQELAQLCARLPLALRIAGERAASHPMMRLAELIDDLRDDSLIWDALSLGDDSATEAVRTVFTWSYRALSADAARLFRLLGVNPGTDLSLPAAAALGATPIRATRRALDLLTGAFMVTASAPGRYELHDLLKAYALAEARTTDSSSALQAAIRRLSAWYSATVEQAAGSLSPGDVVHVPVEEPGIPAPLTFAGPATAYDWFELERQNLVATARTALEYQQAEAAWSLSMATSVIHTHHFTFDDWAVMSEVAVAAAQAIGDPLRHAKALDNRGKYFFRRGLLAEARQTFDQALQLRREHGDTRTVSESLNAMGLVCLRQRALGEAIGYFSQAAAGFESVADARWVALTRSNIMEAHLEMGNAAAALTLASGLPETFQRLNDAASYGNVCWLIAWAERIGGDLESAATNIALALGVAEEASNRMWEGFWLIEAARIHRAAGALDEAMNCCVMAASLQRQIGDTGREAMALDCTGEVFQALGNFDDALAFHSHALRMYESVGDVWHVAVSIANLVACHKVRGDTTRARELSARGLKLLQPFNDSRALSLRERLSD